MITLILVHPQSLSPSQTWSFGDRDVIRVGRSPDNDVVLYSAVVSRHHLELRRIGSCWKIVNLGSNGSFIDDRPLIQAPIIDGLMVRLARSGPQLQIFKGAQSRSVSPGESPIAGPEPQTQSGVLAS
ncbi:FHA domain-containing protein [Oxynema aestuarii]|uniref:FHA domain-containing protein n=1 Tax=Oxynema aestuarii AP17 TaxID=2064643 RepID=A0A6H1TWX3_9CYAN|nr:FHA domain-containing protein [Oxynema aestuarii]QIZ71094.1 FHA domain-containing protein [Oxynema aestuarii AP17]